MYKYPFLILELEWQRLHHLSNTDSISERHKKKPDRSSLSRRVFFFFFKMHKSEAQGNHLPPPPPGYPTAVGQPEPGRNKFFARTKKKGERGFIEGCLFALCCCWLCEECCL